MKKNKYSKTSLLTGQRLVRVVHRGAIRGQHDTGIHTSTLRTEFSHLQEEIIKLSNVLKVHDEYTKLYKKGYK